MVDRDVGGEVFLEALGEGADVDVNLLWRGGLFGVGLSGGIGEERLGEFFRSADGELAADDLVGGEFLGFRIFDSENGFCMADGDLALGEMDLDVLMEIEQAHGIGDRGTRFADAGGNFLLFHRELFGEANVAGRFLDGIEILALEVLDEGHF